MSQHGSWGSSLDCFLATFAGRDVHGIEQFGDKHDSVSAAFSGSGLDSRDYLFHLFVLNRQFDANLLKQLRGERMEVVRHRWVYPTGAVVGGLVAVL